MKPTIESQVDSIVARRSGDLRMSAGDTSEWTKPFEARLPFRLPPSFAALIRRYRFPSFNSGGIMLFGNVDGVQLDDLTVRVFRDRILAAVTQGNGFLQVGQSDTFSYDPVCFDLRKRTPDGEGPLVRLGHEQILISGKATILQTVSKSFLELLDAPEG